MNLLEQEVTDKSFLWGLIPQKKPFTLVDKLLYYSEKKVVSGFTIPKKHILTGDNRFSEPGLIENMAQTIALHTGYKFYLNGQTPPTGYIGAIKKVEILAIPRVLQDLVTTVEIVHDIMGVTLVKAKVECEDRLIAISEMKTVLAK